MLSRTADNLFWMARYVERADFIARIVEAARRLSSLPESYSSGREAWRRAVVTSGAGPAFFAGHAEASEFSVCEFLLFDTANPSSIWSCLDTARNNGRAVRTGLTSETWEGLNGAWNEMTAQGADAARSDLGRFLEWVRSTTLIFDGSARRTMLRNDAYWFIRLGGAVERADNTARILDVRHPLLSAHPEEAARELDYFQWAAVLREVSALTAYRWVYRQGLRPDLVAEFLILNRQMPRSLASCYELINRYLDILSDKYGRRGPAQRLARAAATRLAGLTIEAVFEQGLHAFVTGFLERHAELGLAISDQYLT